MHPRDAMVAGLSIRRNSEELDTRLDTVRSSIFRLKIYTESCWNNSRRRQATKPTICTRLTRSLKTCPKLPFSKKRAAILFTYSTTISGSLQVTYMPLLVRPHTCRDMLWMYVVEVRRVDSLWPGLYSAAAFSPLHPLIFQRHFYTEPYVIPTQPHIEIGIDIDEI